MRTAFPDELSILRHVAQRRFAQDFHCPSCEQAELIEMEIRGHMICCPYCKGKVSITEGTVLANTKLPLTVWFYVMLLTANETRSLSVAFISRHFGISRQAAFRIQSRLRLHFSALGAGKMLGGPGKMVQVDEAWLTFIKPGAPGGDSGAIVFGIYSTEGVVTRQIARRDRAHTYSAILEHVHPESTIVSDEWRGYLTLSAIGFHHVTLCHGKGEFANAEGFSTIGIEGYWANLKRFLEAANVTPTRTHLPGYLAEHAFIYNCRKRGLCPFDAMISRFPKIEQDLLPPSIKKFKEY